MADTTKKNKITYGISNVHIWPILSTTDDGVPTYDKPFAFPGATEISLDAEGDSDPFYADDSIYYQGDANNGYSGSITMADVSEDFATKILMETKDKNGALIENADVETSEFAMAFEFKGDAKKRRHVFYRCKATRPGVESSTKEDSVEPNTPEIDITVAPRLDTKDVKARAEEGDAAYDIWYGDTPYVKDATISTDSSSDSGSDTSGTTTS